MKLLVTGGAGYVGSVCAAHLVENDHEVTVLDDLSTGHENAVPDGARFVRGDLADAADELLADGYDGVLHFAARSLVGESVKRPELYWFGNVVTTLRLLEAMRRHGCPRLVFSSTAARPWATAYEVIAWSMASLLAPYGLVGRVEESSVIGTCSGSP